MSPTTTRNGLPLAKVRALDDPTALRLDAWHTSNAGNGGFLPGAVSTLPLDARLALAADPETSGAWRQRELDRVAGSCAYFMLAYGSVEPPRGPPVPFDLWPSQRDALNTILDADKVWVLKARRLGLTWLALHYALWLAAFAPDGEDARVLVFCKNRADAGKLLDRIKNVHARLPAWLKPEAGKDSATTFALAARRSTITTLAATEAAARQETASLVVLDEFAFTRHGTARGVWTAVQPTIEGGGQLIGISTGNGRTGDGETFARVWDEAASGRNGVAPIFLPWDARPDRSPEWREAQRADYLSEQEFQAEYPETPDEALAGMAALNVYPPDGISAAERIGGNLPVDTVTTAGDGLEIGIDWGDTQTFAVYSIALPAGGVFVLDELALAQTEPSAAAREILSHTVPGVDLPITATRADAAPAGTNRTFVHVLAGTLPDVKHLRVPFSRFKEGGGERRGVNTVGYVRRLLADAVTANPETAATAGGVLVIHPRCELLLGQLRALERDSATGKVRKPALDPSDLSKGDHGPDALVALLAPRAARWREAARDRVPAG